MRKLVSVLAILLAVLLPFAAPGIQNRTQPAPTALASAAPTFSVKLSPTAVPKIRQNALPAAAARGRAAASHNAGKNCFGCHPLFRAAGTVFKNSSGTDTAPHLPVVFTKPNGGEVVLETNSDGNIASSIVPDGRFLIRVNNITSRTWHAIPGQGSCNVCHLAGGNGSPTRTKSLHSYHTQLPSDNDCRHCHHFPASQSYDQLKTAGVLSAATSEPPAPGSRVEILGQVYSFDPAEYAIKTSLRPDIFAPGYFSMFDVILAVAKKNGIRMSLSFDPRCMTYFIKTINGRSGKYWYHFSYDAGSGNSSEINYRRANRWDEALWRPGVWIKVVEGENLDEIKAEYMEEMARQRQLGHVIPRVSISINPSNYKENPPGSDRITVSRDFTNVKVTPHDVRGTGYSSPYPKPFRPGVVTSLDILLSLQDQGRLNLVTGVFYTFFGGHYINSYYVVEMGFPGVGSAHASGRQGFVYVTENGTPNKLPNNADGKLHITSDIHVVHAPDFSTWRWAELGNPYYEDKEPGSAEEVQLKASIKEDFEAIDRGFNLHAPVVRRGGRAVGISYNIFEPGDVRLEVRDGAGNRAATLFDGAVNNIGIQKLEWTPAEATTGAPNRRYSLVMTRGKNTQIREIHFEDAVPSSGRRRDSAGRS